MGFWSKIGNGLKKLAPKHTIVGRIARGNIEGAIKGAKNYVKSGELLADFKNISTGNIGAIGHKALFETKYGGPSKIGGLGKLIPTPKTARIVKRNEKTTQAALSRSAVGKTPETPTKASESTSNLDLDGKTPDTKNDSKINPLYLVGGAAALLLILKRK